MPIFQLDSDDEKAEIEFELNYLKNLSANERLRMMLQKSKEIAKLLKKNEDRKTTFITQRK